MTTTTTEREPQARVSASSAVENGGEHPFQPLLLAALLSRRQEDRRDEVGPLLLALLSRRQEDRRDEVGPLLLALLSRRQEDRRDELSPLLLASLMQRREQRNGAAGINPILLGALTDQG
jgi:hypothetical protein